MGICPFKLNMGKRTVILKETAARESVARIISESFHPEREKVLAVKEYLDSTFKRTASDDIVDGYPEKIPSVALMSVNGEPLKILTMRELLIMLDDKFHMMISDKHDRREFLKAVIKDWFNRDISREGLLTVNVLG